MIVVDYLFLIFVIDNANFFTVFRFHNSDGSVLVEFGQEVVECVASVVVASSCARMIGSRGLFQRMGHFG